MAKEGMKSQMPSSKGWTCMYCGKEKCGCGTMYIIAGIIAIILGIWLWSSRTIETLSLVLAIAFVLGGLKKIMMGFHWGKSNR